MHAADERADDEQARSGEQRELEHDPTRAERGASGRGEAFPAAPEEAETGAPDCGEHRSDECECRLAALTRRRVGNLRIAPLERDRAADGGAIGERHCADGAGAAETQQHVLRGVLARRGRGIVRHGERRALHDRLVHRVSHGRGQSGGGVERRAARDREQLDAVAVPHAQVHAPRAERGRHAIDDGRRRRPNVAVLERSDEQVERARAVVGRRTRIL